MTMNRRCPRVRVTNLTNTPHPRTPTLSAPWMAFSSSSGPTEDVPRMHSTHCCTRHSSSSPLSAAGALLRGPPGPGGGGGGNRASGGLWAEWDEPSPIGVSWTSRKVRVGFPRGRRGFWVRILRSQEVPVLADADGEGGEGKNVGKTMVFH